jgi:hypothetical protein
MSMFRSSLGWTVLCGLLLACQPRGVIPAPLTGTGTRVSECDKLTGCGQCVSNARCGWCGESSRCLSVDTAQACSTGWIPKDPEQTLCQAETPAAQAKP